MKLSVYTVSLPEYDLTEAVALVKQMGYDGVEWRVDAPYGASTMPVPEGVDPYALRYWRENKATLDIGNVVAQCRLAKDLCDQAGLEIVNLAPSLRGGEEELDAVLEAAAAIGCKTIRGPMTRFDPAKSYDEQMKSLRTYLRNAEPKLRRWGVKMLIETHHGMIISSASSAMRVLDGFDPEYFGVIFDPGNMVYEGYEDYTKSFSMLGKYLAHVHIKNAALVPNGEDENGATKYAQRWMPLKKGSANLAALVKALVSVGYDGVLSVEDFSNEKPTQEKLEENIAYLKALIAAAQ